MDQEQQALRELDRANRAQRLLGDELFRETLDEIRSEWRQEWERTRADDVAGRENLYLALRILDRVEKALEKHLTTGKMAAATLEQLRKAGRPAVRVDRL